VNAKAALVAVPSTESFGLPDRDAHLIAKLRAMDPVLRATLPVLTKETTK